MTQTNLAPLAPLETNLKKAAQLLKEGILVAFPTETVYGLGAPIFSPETIAKIFIVKGRPQDNPLIVHISHLEQIHLLSDDVPDDFFLLAGHFFPGPLTVILKRGSRVPDIVSGGLPTIAVRMPDHPIARQLIELVGEPLAAPSANLSGRPSSTRALHVIEDFQGKIPVIDGGECQHGIESTVIALEPRPMIYRPGSISQESLETVLNKKVFLANTKEERPSSPGMKYRHYAPKAPIQLFESMEKLQGYLSSSPVVKRMVLTSIRQEELYERLREADRLEVEEVLICLGAQEQANAALMNRIMRASEK